MASPLKNLCSHSDRYLKSFKVFLDRSTGYQCMKDFIADHLPGILTSIVKEKSNLNIIGVGSGSGELDLKILSVLHENYPQMKVRDVVVEPNPQQLHDYRDLVSRTPDLDYIIYKWNKMTADEFEADYTEKRKTEKADLIHMFQMLYCVDDAEATISFYQSLLNRNGKLLISLVTDDSGWGKLTKIYGNQLFNREVKFVTSGDIKRFLDSKGLSYQSYEVPSETDITECFTDGGEGGELLLDFLTQVQDFSESAPPELKAAVMDFLRLECSEEANGKVLFNYNFEVIVIDPLN